MSKHYEPVFLDTSGRRCGEGVPYDVNELLAFTTEGAIADNIRRALDKRKKEQEPLYWVDFL